MYSEKIDPTALAVAFKTGQYKNQNSLAAAFVSGQYKIVDSLTEAAKKF